MSIFAVVYASLVGLAVGSFVNVVVSRVPAGASLLTPSRCDSCGAPVRAWQNVPVLAWLALRGRCRECQAPIGARTPLVEAGTGAAFAAITAWTGTVTDGLGHALLAVTLCAFAAVSIALALIDLDTHRLPDAVVGPAYPVAAALLAGTSGATGDWGALARAGVGLVVLALGYYAVHVVRPDGMGFGDVKLAGLIGLVTGYVGWGALAVGAFAAFVLAGGYGVALLATGRADRRSGLAFGPWMLAGGWLGLVAGAPLAAGYLQMSGLS